MHYYFLYTFATICVCLRTFGLHRIPSVAFRAMCQFEVFQYVIQVTHKNLKPKYSLTRKQNFVNP